MPPFNDIQSSKFADPLTYLNNCPFTKDYSHHINRLPVIISNLMRSVYEVNEVNFMKFTFM